MCKNHYNQFIGKFIKKIRRPHSREVFVRLWNGYSKLQPINNEKDLEEETLEDGQTDFG